MSLDMSGDISFLDTPTPQIPSVREAGRLGGQAVLKRKGKAYFVNIGRLGQIAMRQKYPNMASVWGKKGGRPKKPNLEEIMGENGK